MEELLKQIIEFIYRLFAPIRDKERRAEDQLEINKKVDKADEIIGDMSVADRDDVLAGLHRRTGRRRTGKLKRD